MRAPLQRSSFRHRRPAAKCRAFRLKNEHNIEGKFFIWSNEYNMYWIHLLIVIITAQKISNHIVFVPESRGIESTTKVMYLGSLSRSARIRALSKLRASSCSRTFEMLTSSVKSNGSKTIAESSEYSKTPSVVTADQVRPDKFRYICRKLI